MIWLLLIRRQLIQIFSYGKSTVNVMLNLLMKCPLPTVTCNANQRPCNDGSKCVLIGQFCDGVIDCPGAFDEDAALCGPLTSPYIIILYDISYYWTVCDVITLISIATPCDKQFLLTGPNGSFSASGHQGDTPCRWLIRCAHTLWHTHGICLCGCVTDSCFQGGSRALYWDQLSGVSLGRRSGLPETLWRHRRKQTTNW